ncbi:MAG TPA: hypothetical protein VF538_12960 [Pyrinomonadaceae bacterium]|jgi:hypothetical protein
MADQDKEGRGSGDEGGTQGGTGDPGRTPGTAEGDEETVDADLERQQGGRSL